MHDVRLYPLAPAQFQVKVVEQRLLVAHDERLSLQVREFNRSPSRKPVVPRDDGHHFVLAHRRETVQFLVDENVPDETQFRFLPSERRQDDACLGLGHLDADFRLFLPEGAEKGGYFVGSQHGNGQYVEDRRGKPLEFAELAEHRFVEDQNVLRMLEDDVSLVGHCYFSFAAVDQLHGEFFLERHYFLGQL